MKTFEQAEEEGLTPYDFEVQSRDISFNFEFRADGVERIEEFADNLDQILRPTPGDLTDRILDPGDGGVDFPGPQPTDPSFDLDLSALDNAGLLRVIASATIAQTRSMFNIEDFLSPFGRITVVGSNAIDDANSAQPVVPESDDVQIPTRTVFVRASKDNTSPIWVGDDGVGVGSGYPLYKGEGRDFSFNLGGIVPYMVSEEAGQQIYVIGAI